MGRLLIQFAGTNTTKALSETLPKNTIIVDEDLHQLRLHDGTTQGGHIIGGSGGGGVPVGTIIPFAGNSIPEGYLLCDGSAISRTDYATLFAVIGTIYGTGDGNSTFNLPDLRHRLPMHGYFSSESIGELITGILPNISGTFAVGQGEYQRIPFTKVSGCFTSGTGSTIYTHDIDGGWNGGRYDGVKFLASRSSSIYKDNAEGVIPRSIIMKYIIKYI